MYLKEDYEEILENKFSIIGNEKKQLSMILQYLFSGFRNRSNRPLPFSFTTAYSDGDGDEVNYDWDARSIRHEYSSRIYFNLGLNDLLIEPREIINFLEDDLTEAEIKSKLAEYTNESKISEFMNLLRNEVMFNFENSYKNYIRIICLLVEQNKLASDQEFLAKILLDKLPQHSADHEEYSLYKDVFDFLKKSANDLEKLDSTCVFILKLIYNGAVYLRKQTYFKTRDEIKEKIDELFLKYLKSNSIDGDYFFRVLNLVEKIYLSVIDQSDFNKQQYLKEMLESDKELFRNFLKASIYSSQKDDKKSIWSRWYERFADLSEEGIKPIFNGQQDYKKFIENIKVWEAESFVQTYIAFMKEHFEKDVSLDFDINDLNV